MYGVIGDFTIATEAFALEQALLSAPEITIEADRLVSHSPKEVFPFLWATGGDCEQFHDTLADEPTVTDGSVAEETGEEVLFRLEWSDSYCDLIQEMIDHHVTIIEARALGDQ